MMSEYRYVLRVGKPVHFYKDSGVWYFLCRHNVDTQGYEAAVDYVRQKNSYVK